MLGRGDRLFADKIQLPSLFQHLPNPELTAIIGIQEFCFSQFTNFIYQFLMKLLRQITKSFTGNENDEEFLKFLGGVETIVSKILSLAMVFVILIATVELCIFIGQEILLNNKLLDPERFSSFTIIRIFGLFLNVLIALEVLENITAYLKKHVIQVELVIVTSLIAVARKIIIFDFSKSTGIELIALAAAIFALSISYWIVKQTATRH